MRVAIMQPTFLPWLGYFALLSSVDHFAFLDDVKYAPQSWHSRNRIKTPHGELMVSLPIASVHSSLKIKHATISPVHNHRKFLKRLSSNYSMAPHGDICLQIVDTAYKKCGGSLSEFNIGIISAVTQLCGINTILSRISEMPDIQGAKGQRVYNIAKTIGASQYVSPTGSLSYLQNDNPFADSEISLRFVNFSHPEYPQGKGPFLPNMAVIDALAWVGPTQLTALLAKSLGKEYTIAELASNDMGHEA